MPAEEKGFIHIVLILVILIVATIGGITFLALQKSDKTKSPTSVVQNLTSTTKTTSFKVMGEAKLLFTGGYADPTLSTLPDGKLIMYINNFSKQPSKYEAHTSMDGLSWSKVSAKLPNASTGRAVKFGNQTRLYYPDRTPIRPTDPPASILSAISNDGLNFTNETGTRVDPRDGYYVEGPTVFKLPDGTYRMLFSENETASAEKRISTIWGASSVDGFAWTRDEKPTLEATAKDEHIPTGWPQALHPFVLVKQGGGYLMFYNTHSEVYAAESKDGLAWTKLGAVGIHGADVDGYFEKDGSIRLFYGDFSPETQGVVYTVLVKVN